MHRQLYFGDKTHGLFPHPLLYRFPPCHAIIYNVPMFDLTTAAFCCILYRQFTLICPHVCAVNVNYLICNCTITVSRYIFHCKQVVEMPRCEIYKPGPGSSCARAKALSRKYTVSPFSIDTFISNGRSGTLKDRSLQ